MNNPHSAACISHEAVTAAVYATPSPLVQDAVSSTTTFRQLFDATSSTFTYLLGDDSSKTAIIIDPVLDQVERDLQIVEELGLTLRYALNTHCHADHVTGSGEIKKRCPLTKSAISEASGCKADILLHDGDEVHFGGNILHVLATPGHTNGCMSYYTESLGGMIFTGDTLLIRGCGRTDFQEGNARKLHRSVHRKLFTLPASTKVYPAHDYKGHACSTIGEEMAFNPRLRLHEDAFKKLMDDLHLPYPKMMDLAVPANTQCGS
ncbi:g1091 [Coccomyxa elongata]